MGQLPARPDPCGQLASPSPRLSPVGGGYLRSWEAWSLDTGQGRDPGPHDPGQVPSLVWMLA